jgi:hypothetical protein
MISSYTKDFSQKNDLNSLDFEGLGFQMTRLLWWVPVCKQIFDLKTYSGFINGLCAWYVFYLIIIGF